MYFDISKVYGGVRLNPVHSALSLYTVYFCDGKVIYHLLLFSYSYRMFTGC